MNRELQQGDKVTFKPDFMEHDPCSWGPYVELGKVYTVIDNDNSDSAPIHLDINKPSCWAWFHPCQLELVSEDVTEGWSL